jgi:hypothetical protein
VCLLDPNFVFAASRLLISAREAREIDPQNLHSPLHPTLVGLCEPIRRCLSSYGRQREEEPVQWLRLRLTPRR